MSWITFTDADLHLAQAFRLARLTSLVPTPQETVLHLDQEHILHICCNNEDILTSLQLFSRDLQQQVYLVLGSREIWLWNDRDPVEQIRLESFLILDLQPSSMTTATLERPSQTPASAPPEPSTVADVLPGQTIAAIAEDTEQTVEAVRTWLMQQGFNCFFRILIGVE